jgi:CHAT domain-containing protein/tetratricopeptide (TPR) repeat protein
MRGLPQALAALLAFAPATLPGLRAAPAQPPIQVSSRPFTKPFSEGVLLEQTHDYAQALAAYDRAVPLAETDADRYYAFSGRARCASALGQHAAARADIEAADQTAKSKTIPWEHTLDRLHITRDQGDLIAASAAFRALQKLADTTRDKKITLFLEEAHLKRAWGDLSGAINAFDQVEFLLKEANNLSSLSDFDRERATARLGLRDFDGAAKLARNALSIELRRVGTSRRRPESDWVRLGDIDVAQSLLVTAEVQRQAGETKAAGETFKLALDLARKVDAPREIVRAHFGLARLNLAAGNILGARLNLVGAMLLTQEGKIPDLHIETIALVGETCLREDDPAGAIGPLTLGIEQVEKMRLTAPPEDRQRLLALQADHYRWLLEAYLRTGKFWEALATSEGLKARTLRDSIAENSFATDLNFHDEGSDFMAGMMKGLGKSLYNSPDQADSIESRVARLREFQRRLPPDLAVVSYANADWNRSDPVAFVMTAHELKAVRLPFTVLPDFLQHLNIPEVLAAQTRDVDATRYDLGSEITLAGLVAYYREQIYCDPKEIAARAPALVITAKILRYLLFNPLTSAIGDHPRLLISPSGLLAYVPFDTLREPDGKTILNRYAISLTPSLLTSLALAERPPATYERPFLGFGGAVYDPRSYSKDIAGASQIKLQMEAVTAVRSAQVAGNRSPYAGWSRGPASNLAGTKAEVQLLSDLLPGSRVVIGRDVSEPHIRKMAAAGELRQNRVLHFAVHGSAVPIMPELSCILLSWEGEITPDMPAERDGRLQIGEFEQLSLRAELVTFSACETGLGAIVAGEGVIGLTGSLLTAGADNVLASLWPVSDYSTVYFMRRYYEMHLLEGVPSDIAIARVKRDMEANKLPGYAHPQFWAPFNLYGGRELFLP